MTRYVRHAKKAHRDANHPHLVEVLNALGFLVWDMADVGEGFPDLLVARRGVLSLVEVKNPERYWKTQDRKTHEKQAAFADLAKRLGGVTVYIVETLDDVTAFSGKVP